MKGSEYQLKCLVLKRNYSFANGAKKMHEKLFPFKISKENPQQLMYIFSDWLTITFLFNDVITSL